MSEYSKNEQAEQLVGLRPTGGRPIDQPCELDYHCPACEYENIINGNFDERLEWSEYNGFLWCSECNVDYPSALCVPHDQPERAIKVYLACIGDAISLKE